MLTKADRDKIRGMLADKQSAKTIAAEFGVDEEDVRALAKPKAVCSGLKSAAQSIRLHAAIAFSIRAPRS
eukprot:5789673-Pleurochrysis_carterae.AAC.1